jgi:hypothetical protein
MKIGNQLKKLSLYGDLFIIDTRLFFFLPLFRLFVIVMLVLLGNKIFKKNKENRLIVYQQRIFIRFYS